MKQVKRLDEPESFFKDDKKIDFYKDLRDNNEKIRDRWNLPKYQSDLKKVLSDMSNGECVFCGKYVGTDNFDIDHYLPKEAFPYLSYSFENYLCTCEHCNENVKKTYYPKSLDNIKDKLGEQILVGKIEGIIPYSKKEVLERTKDRIIEPTLDNISQHIEFDPATCNYTIKDNSNIGKETNKMFFQHREMIDILQKISEQVFNMVKNKDSKKTVLGWSKICGYSFYIEKLYDFWAEFLSS